MTEPDTWNGFRTQADALFGGQTPREQDEATILPTWLANSRAVWNAALSISTEIAGGRVDRGWPALAARCLKLAQATAARPADRGPALTGQSALPEPTDDPEERARVLEQSGAARLLRELGVRHGDSG